MQVFLVISCAKITACTLLRQIRDDVSQMKNNPGIKMPSGMTIGSPTLRIKDLQKQMSFYTNILGLQINRTYKTDGMKTVDLGFNGRFKGYGEPLLILKHDPDAKEDSHDFSGLYHFAILVPDRKSLASAYLSIKNSNTSFDGFADHLVSESLYLHDPERNGIEIYRDKPRNEWQYDLDGHVIMDTLQLDLKSVLSELQESERKNITFPNGARIGHMHLRVTNLERSVKFYQGLGLDITFDWSAMGASFLSAGGYHHHIGLNTWHSLNGRAHHKSDAGLDTFEITVPDRSFIDTLKRELEDRVQKTNQEELLLSDPDGILFSVKSG